MGAQFELWSLRYRREIGGSRWDPYRKHSVNDVRLLNSVPTQPQCSMEQCLLGAVAFNPECRPFRPSCFGT
jgi:hypothetical protein